MIENEIAKEIVDAAYKIHTTLGPGLLESVYEVALAYELEQRGLSVVRQQPIPIVYESVTFDEGFRADLVVENKVIVECKSHKWTEGDNVPSAKLTVWNEAMLYFIAAPVEYRKIMVVLKDYSPKRQETLAQHYLRTYSHLIPKGVELWEYDEQQSNAIQIG